MDVLNKIYRRKNEPNIKKNKVQRTSSKESIIKNDSVYDNTAIQINMRQKGNPLLKHIGSQVLWQWNSEIVADYVVGRSACVIFLSLRFHLLQPKYIHSRLTKLGRAYKLRILLCLIDVEDVERVLEELTLLCFRCNLTLVCVWSTKEGARYLETFKAYEKKSVDSITERVE
eukprot:UN25677